MIPPQRPAFGIGTDIHSSLPARGGAGIAKVEAAYGRIAANLHPVWLPSVRAGICWALQSATKRGTKVVAPAFTCGVVHEAVVRAGGAMELIDAATDGFLTDANSLVLAQNGTHALVLCELYGEEYDLASAGRDGAARPVLRVVDMAMSVPHPALFQRLGSDDFGLISFGAGKTMYAGWGAMGFAGNAALAAEVKARRDAALAQASFGLHWQRAARAFVRVLGHYPPVYTLAKRLRPPVFHRDRADAPAENLPAVWFQENTTSVEWRQPATGVDCALAIWNAENAGFSHDARVELAQRYEQNLADVPELIRPRNSKSALSHYTIGVNAAFRSRVRQALFQQGVNTITLWEFHKYLDRNRLPCAFRRSSEVINLPLIPGMGVGRVDRICRHLKQCLDELKVPPH